MWPWPCEVKVKNSVFLKWQGIQGSLIKQNSLQIFLKCHIFNFIDVTLTIWGQGQNLSSLYPYFYNNPYFYTNPQSKLSVQEVIFPILTPPPPLILPLDLLLTRKITSSVANYAFSMPLFEKFAKCFFSLIVHYKFIFFKENFIFTQETWII